MQSDSFICDNLCMQLLNELDDAILLINKQGIIVEANQAACDLYGYQRSELCRKQFNELMAPHMSSLPSVVTTPNNTIISWHCSLESSAFCAEVLMRSLHSSECSNSAELTLVKVRNISSQHKAETQRKRDYQIYKAVVESSPLLITRVLPDTTVTFANDAFCAFFGHIKTELVGKKLYDFPPDQETRDFIVAHFADFAKNPRIITHDNIVLNAEGHQRWVQFTESPIFDSNGNLHEVQTVAIDIHEQKLAEIKIQQNEEKYRAIMDQSNEGIALLEMKTGRLYEANRKMCEILGYSAEELLKCHHHELTTESEETIKAAEIELNRNEALPLANINVIAKDGRLVEVERLAKRLVLDGKNLALISIRDVSERNRINSLLVQQAEELQKKVEQLQKAWSQTIDVLAAASEAKDPYTAGHQKRVAQLAVAVGLELGLPEDQITGLRMASLIHDIGKITVPAELLSKPGSLTLLEYKLVQTHVSAGYEMLRNLDLPWSVADVVHQHHERINGSGYPNQLLSDQILFKAKILGVADVVEAMSSHRPYRPSLGIDIALREIEKGKGSQFDSDVVDTCIKLFREKRFHFDDVHTSPPTWDIANRTFKESSTTPY